MGRRKSKRKPEARKKNIEALDTQFTCPFCNHEKSCEVPIYLLKLSWIECVVRWKWIRVNMLPRSSVLFAWRIFRQVCHTHHLFLKVDHSTPDSRSPQNRQQSTSCQSQWTSTMNGSTLVRPSTTDHSIRSLKISNLWSFVCDFWYSLGTTLL